MYGPGGHRAGAAASVTRMLRSTPFGFEGAAQEFVRQMMVVDDERCREARLAELIRDEVFGARGAAGSVAEVRRERRSGRDRIADLLGRRARVADGGDHTQFGDLLDIAKRSGPFGRERDQTHMAFGGVLPAEKLSEVGRADPFPGMRAARAVLGRNVRAFDVEGFHRLSFRKRLARGGEIAQGREHGVGRAGNHGREEPRNAGGEDGADGPVNVVVRRRGRIEINAREAVDLEIDETGGEEDAVVGVVTIPGRQKRIDVLDRRIEFDFDALARNRAASATFHHTIALCTAYPQKRLANSVQACGKQLLKTARSL